MLFDQKLALQNYKFLKWRELAPRARFELATLRLTGECSKNLSAVSGVAYKKSGVIFPSLAPPNAAPKIPMINPIARLPSSIRLLVFRRTVDFAPFNPKLTSENGQV